MAITNVSVFRSSDGGAVSGVNGRCSGTIGDGIALLNMLLLVKGGYNWQAVTASNLTCSGTTASLTLTAHGFNIDQRLWIIGMDQSGYLHSTTYGDATYPGTVADANTLTFPTTGTPTTATTGGGAGGTTTTLNGAIVSTSATSVPVTDGVTHYPGSIPFVVKVDSEYMLVTAGMGTNTWTVLRGMFGTTAATHLTAATVTQTIVIGVAPAGGFNAWTSPWTTTNKASYLKPAGTAMELDVDDTHAQYVSVRGWETMSANNTGTGEFPTTGQIAAGAQAFAKSSAADTTVRAWVCTASDRMLHLWIDSQNGLATPNAHDYLGFYDLIDQTKSGDAYATVLASNSTIGTSGNSGAFGSIGINAVATGLYMPRSYTQIGTAIQVGRMSLDNRFNAATTAGAGGMTYPHPSDGGLYVSKFFINEGSAAITRGTTPGLWNILHAKPALHLDTWLGTGAFAGKKFMAVNAYNGGQIAMEISNTIQGT